MSDICRGDEREETRDKDPVSQRQRKRQAHSPAPAGSDVGGNFYNGIEWLACWLLDHAEGETITEEQLRSWAVEAWREHLKRQNDPDERPGEKQ